MWSELKTRIKWMIFPGMNLHARLRYQCIPKHFDSVPRGEERNVLDAGCGNGMLSYQSYLKRNKVFGVSFKEKEVQGCQNLFNRYLGIPKEKLCFQHRNLYQLDFPRESFDEIICSEVLEHLKNDTLVCRTFFQSLKPGGVLHVCAPNAEHPYNSSFPLDQEESGGHVRPGYTMESYKTLLETIGFEIINSEGLGGPIRQAFNWRIKEVQTRFGPLAGLPLFLLALPFIFFDSKKKESKMPFSLYVKARKVC